MDDETNPSQGPLPGSPESAAWFRAALAELELSQSAFARLLQRKGDDRKPMTILRTIQRMATGHGRVSGEMRVILHLMLTARRRALKRLAPAETAGPPAASE